MTTGAGGSTDRGRRAFLRRAAGIGADRALGPPPPALSLEIARGNPCRDCAAPCVAACGPDIIRRHGEGHPMAGLAYLSFGNDGCTFCGDCVEVCPVERAEPPPSTLGLAILSRDACLAWNGVVCMSCRFACPERAIVADRRGRPTVMPPACTGCGMCVGVCPPAAIEVAY